MGHVPVHPREDPRHVRRNLVYRTIHGKLIINVGHVPVPLKRIKLVCACTIITDKLSYNIQFNY
jgi:hypothetical protein